MCTFLKSYKTYLFLGEWIQTISIKNNVPIDKNGSLSLLSNDIENRFLFLSLNTNEIHLPKQMSDSGPRIVLKIFEKSLLLVRFEPTIDMLTHNKTKFGEVWKEKICV